MTDRATDRQIAYATRLIASRDTDGVTVPDPAGLDRRQASALIDRLRRCPERVRNGLTSTQVREAVDLADQAARVLGQPLAHEDRARLTSRLAAGGPDLVAQTVAASRRTIDGVPKPRAQVTREAAAALRGNPNAVLTPNGCGVGVYMLEDEDGQHVLRLRLNRGRDRLYCERLEPVSGTWSYAPEARRRIMPRNRMTAAQAAAFGRMTGVCAMCGRRLTDPESVAAGIGPVCLSKTA